MSSRKDYCSPDDSGCDSLRRSERVTRYRIRKTKATIAKKSCTKGGKKMARAKNNEKLLPDKKWRANGDSGESEARIFSGEPLNPAELHQLLIKFKEDGHFCYKVANSSSPQPVASSTNDIGSATKRQKQRDAMTPAVTSKRTERDESVAKNRILGNAIVSEAMTSSNRLPNATGSTLQISASKSQYVPASRSERKSWSGPIICHNLLSSGSFREGNGIDFSWDKDPFPSVAPSGQSQVAPVLNTCKHVLKDTNTSASWKSIDRGQPSNRKDANACGFYSNRDKSQTGSNDNSTRVQIGRSNRENMDNSYINCAKLRSTETLCNNVCANYNENGSTVGSSLGKQMNSGNPTFVTPTEGPYGNSANIWNVNGPNISNTLTTDNSSMQHPTGPQNTLNYVSSDFGCNNENRNSNDLQHHAYGFGVGANSGIGYNNNYNAHYLMTWKSLQVFPSPYSNANDVYVNDASNCPIPPVLPSMFVNEPGHLVNQTNYWLQNDLSNRGNFLNTFSETGLPVAANGFANPTHPTTTMTDGSTVSTRINTNDKTSFFLDDFPDNQNKIFCPTVSSIGSYDDIYYDNCLAIDKNAVTTTITPHYESILDPLTTMKAEVRPMYDATANYSQHSHNCKFNNQTSTLYNFETRTELANSPHCVIIPNSTRT